MHSYFIIENHQTTIKIIQEILEEQGEYYCIGTSDDYEEGMNLILKHHPDMVFINIDQVDINTPDVFAYCREMQNYITNKIFFIALSNDERKAYQALKNKFYDYIIKPLRELDIRKTAMQFLKDQNVLPPQTLCLKSYKDYTILKMNDILFLEADNNATDFILVSGKKVSVFKTLKTFEAVLPAIFIRIHHSYIVNTDHISKISFGKLKCSLHHNKIHLPFSKSYRHNLDYLENALEQNAVSYN